LPAQAGNSHPEAISHGVGEKHRGMRASEPRAKELARISHHGWTDQAL
jgi:hypothetical protein